jgi:hypothetical protein
MRAAMVGGAGFGDVATDLVWVAGYTAAVAVLAVIVFRRRMVE